MKTVLVTGGTGFIGGYVVEELRREGIEPLIFDRKADRKDVASGEVFLGTTTDYAAVCEAVAHTDGFIHLAGVLGTQETINEPGPAVATNIVGGLNVFRAARNYNRKGVYIAVGNHWMNNSYSITKTTAERFALMFNKEHGTRIAVVRALNAYGPRQKAAPVRKIMPNLVIPALRSETITVYGSGDQVMDMVYVKDVARILVRALLMDHGVYDTVFEAGTGVRTTVNDVVREVIRAAAPHGGKPKVEHVAMRPGEPENSEVLGDPDTLKPLEYGPDAMWPLDLGVRTTVGWYAQHKDVW